MKKINNLTLFDFSLKNPEPIIDEFYVKKGNLIIAENPKDKTVLMQRNLDLLESISVYNFAKKAKDKLMAKKAIEEILKIIKSKNINYSEFVSFWPIVDISHSIFSKMEKEEQLHTLENIVVKYLELRHGLYSSYGYTPTTLQVGKDAKAHKESGSLGVNKVSKILSTAGFIKANIESTEDFIQGDKKYIEADKKGKKLFKKLLAFYKIRFSWSSKKENKMPDFLIKYKDHIFILEHKHMKEGGGGQDKQINEIISFINFSETNKKIHYISFLDGIYFNLFVNKKYLSRGKILQQITNIRQGLKKNEQNYFVNTSGFRELLSSLN